MRRRSRLLRLRLRELELHVAAGDVLVLRLDDDPDLGAARHLRVERHDDGAGEARDRDHGLQHLGHHHLDQRAALCRRQQRREALLKLRDLGDRRALDVLHKLRADGTPEPTWTNTGRPFERGSRP